MADATVAAAPSKNFFEKLTQAVYLDYVLKVVGVGGFAWTFLNSWHALGLGIKAGMLASVAAWVVGERFNKIYR